MKFNPPSILTIILFYQQRPCIATTKSIELLWPLASHWFLFTNSKLQRWLSPRIVTVNMRRNDFFFDFRCSFVLYFRNIQRSSIIGHSFSYKQNVLQMFGQHKHHISLSFKAKPFQPIFKKLFWNNFVFVCRDNLCMHKTMDYRSCIFSNPDSALKKTKQKTNTRDFNWVIYIRPNIEFRTCVSK